MSHRLARAVALLCCTVLPAQWSANPAQNLPIGDGVGEQALPKIAATSDGGCYVGWFDHRGTGYAVHLQRLDPAGVEQWPHGGVLVSGNPQSTSLVDWDLIADRDDHCVLTFTDTRAGGDLDVYAYRVDPAGNLLWGTNGVALSNNGDYEPNPRVCEASDGDFVFVWANTGQRTLQLQRLDRAGNPRFPGDGIAIPGETGATPGFCRVVAAEAGGAIVSWVRTIAFTGNKHIHAQKFDAAGNPLWNGGTRVAVFDGGAVPIAHEPRLVPDGGGGALVGWHFAVGQQFFVRVQRLLANGAAAWAHNGVDVSNNGNSRFDPALVWRASSQEAFVAWNERNLGQSQWGIVAQKLAATGLPAWGPTGVALIPVGATVQFAPVAVPCADGVTVAVLEESLGIGRKKVRAFGLDGAGSQRFAVDASTVASDKLRLQAAASPSGVALLVWGDLRADGGDVIGQDVNPDGSLGNGLGTVTPYGCGVNPAGSLTTGGRPALGTTMTLGVDNPLGTQAIGALAFLVLALQPDPAFPCGTVVPGYGMAGAGAAGEVLVLLGGGVSTVFGGFWGGVGNAAPFTLALPPQTALAGTRLWAQGLLLDPNPGAAVVVGVTTAVRLTAGF